jgi:transcriptional regulator with XRE-family HTH domain
MTEKPRPETPSDVVARRVREVRRRRGWSAARLAEQCARVGAPHLTESVIANIESGRPDEQGRRRREVSVDEVIALALALEIAPVVLLVRFDNGKPYQVTPARVELSQRVRTWVRGLVPLDGMDRQNFYNELPFEDGPLNDLLRGDDVQGQLAVLKEATRALREAAETVKRQRDQEGNADG